MGCIQRLNYIFHLGLFSLGSNLSNPSTDFHFDIDLTCYTEASKNEIRVFVNRYLQRIFGPSIITTEELCKKRNYGISKWKFIEVWLDSEKSRKKVLKVFDLTPQVMERHNFHSSVNAPLALLMLNDTAAIYSVTIVPRSGNFSTLPTSFFDINLYTV